MLKTISGHFLRLLLFFSIAGGSSTLPSAFADGDPVEVPAPFPFQSLPVEIQAHILQFLGPFDLIRSIDLTDHSTRELLKIPTLRKIIRNILPFQYERELTHQSPVTVVAFSPNGDYFASAGSGNPTTIWNFPGGTEFKVLPIHDSYNESVAFSPDLKWIATGLSFGVIQVWDFETNQVVHTLDGGFFHISNLLFSNDGSKLLSVPAGQGYIKIWDTLTGRPLKSLLGHTAPITSIASLSHEDFIVSSSNDGIIQIWNMDTGKAIKTLSDTNDTPQSVAISPDKSWIASGGISGRVKIWDIKNAQPTDTLIGHTSSVNAVAFSPCGTQLASASTDHSIKIWNVRTGKVISTLDGHQESVESIAFSPDGLHLISASRDKTVKVWTRGAQKQPNLPNEIEDRAAPEPESN